jgi:hypothetical protein
MHSEALDALIVELGRDAPIDLPQRIMLEAHVARCRRCASRLGEEQRLTAALGQLARASANAQAPTRVEERLRAAFRRQHRKAAAPPGRSWLWPTLAAALLVFALLFVRPDGHVQQPSPPAAAAAEPLADGFIPIRLAHNQPEGDGVRIARVEMAPQALTALGLPLLVEAETDRPIVADVLLGQDGLAHAIRLLR